MIIIRQGRERSMINTAEKIKVDKEALLSKHSKEELATICSMIAGKLCDKANELQELFTSLKNTYPDIFCLVDFGLICTVTSTPTSQPIFEAVTGTPEGITKAAKEIISALRGVAKGVADEKTA